jgi:hypothetical protein
VAQWMTWQLFVQTWWDWLYLLDVLAKLLLAFRQNRFILHQIAVLLRPAYSKDTGAEYVLGLKVYPTTQPPMTNA